MQKTDVPTYTKVFSDTLVKLGEMDPKVLAFTAAMGEGAGTSDFSKRFPKGLFDVGIAEQHAVTMAAALALEGFKPVVAIYSTFLQRAYDQIVHDVCLQNAPVVFALDRAGLVGEDGPTHHGVFDLSYLRHIPNLTIMAPKDENELQHMLYTGILHNGPVAIRYPRGCGLGVPLDADFRPLPIGRAEVLQKGRDLTLIAVGSMVDCAVKVSRLLTQKGVACTVINARFIKPLDAETILEAVNNTNGVVTLEENVLNGGFGSAILELMAEEGLEQKVLRIGLEDSFSTHGNINTLREIYGLTPEKVLQRIEEEFSFKAVNKLNKLAINLIRRNR